MRAVVLTYGYEARIPQVLSTLSILSSNDTGRLLQIATGEGKTLTTAMIAAAKVLQGHTVDVISSSPVLAVRDGKSVQSFLTKLGLTVGIIPEEGGKSREGEVMNAALDKETLYSHPIVYGSLSQFQGDYLRTVFSSSPGRDQRPFDTVLVDEADSSMIDEIHHITMLSGHQTGMEFLQVFLTALWNKTVELSQRVVYIPSKEYWVYIDGEFTLKDGELYLHASSGSPETRVHIIQDAYAFKKRFLQTYAAELLQSSIIQVPSHLTSLIQTHFEEWVTSALAASYHKENVTYVCGTSPEGVKSIMPVDVQNTGVVQTNMHWSNGVHQFLQLKHGLPLTSEGFVGSFISHIGYIQKYGRNIFGMSGTLGGEATAGLFKHVYNVDLLRMPRFRTRQFRELPGRMLATTTLWKSEIIASIRAQTSLGKGCLVICKTIQEAMNLRDALKEHISEGKLKLYARNDDKKQENVVETVLEPGAVIIATNLAGRGTDIKVSREVLTAGGMHVCLTFLPKNSRVEEQALGRTARKGESGTGELILCKPHIIHQLGQTLPLDVTIEQLRKMRDRIESKRLKEVVHHDVPYMLMKDRLFLKVCELRNKLKHIDANEGRLSEFEDQWAFEHHTLTSKKRRHEEDSKRKLETTLNSYGLTIVQGKDDLDTVYHAIRHQLEADYTVEDLKRMAFQHVLAQKSYWTNTELRELARSYHDSRRWKYRENVIILALSEALNRSIIVLDTYGVEVFAEQTKGNKRIFLTKTCTAQGYGKMTYYAAQRCETGDYERLTRELSIGLQTSLLRREVDQVQVSDLDKVLKYCDEEALKTAANDHRDEERDILKHFDAFAKRVEQAYRSGKGFMKSAGNLCWQARVSNSSTQRISALTEAIRQDSEYSYGAYYQRATELIKAKKGNYKQQAMADFKHAKERTENVKAIWEAMLITYRGDAKGDLAQQLQAKIQYLDRLMKQCDRNIKQIRTCKSGNDIVLGRYTSVLEFKGVGGLNNEVVQELLKAGAPGYYELEERSPPTSWVSVFTVGILGVMQVVVGAVITVASGGAVGSTLISEGIKDIWASIKLAYNGGAFDWAEYFLEKSISTAMALIQLGGGKVLDKVLGRSTEAATAATSKVTEEAAKTTAASATTSKVAEETAKATLTGEATSQLTKEITFTSVVEAIKPVAIESAKSMAIMEVSHWTARQLIDSFSDDIYDTLKKTIADKLKSEALYKGLEAVWIIDALMHENNEYQQSVLKEVDHILKAKQSRMVEMIGRLGGVFTTLFKEKDLISNTTAIVIKGALETARATKEVAEIMSFVEEVIADLKDRVHVHLATAPTLAKILNRDCDAIDWIEHCEYGTLNQGAVNAIIIKHLKELALKEGIQEADSASTRPWWDVEVSSEVCDACVQWLLMQKIVTSERPWGHGGIGLSWENRAELIALESLSRQDRQWYKALNIVGCTLNTLHKFHLDGHRADGFIKVLGEQLEEQLHTALTHRLSSTVGRSIESAATIGLNAYSEVCKEETRRKTEAALQEMRKHSVLFRFLDKKPVQPWEKDAVVDKPVYVPYAQRFLPSVGGSGLALVKPEYQWLTTLPARSEPVPAVTNPAPKPATASVKAPTYVDPKGMDSMGQVQALRKEREVNESLAAAFTPEQLHENVSDAEYKKTPSYQVEQELKYIKHRTLEMQGMTEAQKNTPEWRKEFMELHQSHERLGVFDPEWRERQAIAGGAAIVAGLTAVAPEVMVPLMGRMAIGGIAGEATRQVWLQEGFSESEANFGSAVVGGAVSAHMPVGGMIAKGSALTTEAAVTSSEKITSIQKLNVELQSYLGENYKTITNKAGDKVFLSQDGTRCVRFDVKNPHGDVPHMHIQYFNGKKWLDTTSTHRIQFKD